MSAPPTGPLLARPVVAAVTSLMIGVGLIGIGMCHCGPRECALSAIGGVFIGSRGLAVSVPAPFLDPTFAMAEEFLDRHADSVIDAACSGVDATLTMQFKALYHTLLAAPPDEELAAHAGIDNIMMNMPGRNFAAIHTALERFAELAQMAIRNRTRAETELAALLRSLAVQ